MNKSFQERFLLKHLGDIPSSWVNTQLGDIFEEYKELNNDLDRYPLYSFTIEKGVTPKTDRYERSFLLKDKENNEYRLVRFNDFIFNPMNLRVGAISCSRETKTVSVSAYYNILELKKENSNTVFVESFLKSALMMDLYDRVAIGSLVEKRRVHLSEFVKLYIPLPPLAEQEGIARVLGCWDRGISVLERLIAAKQKRKKALMQQLLTGKRRFKEFQGQQWKEVRLGDIGQIVSGGTPDTSKEDYWKDEIAWCIPTDITALSSRYISATKRLISKTGLQKSAATLLPPKSIVVCTRATVGDCAINTIPISTNQGFKSIIPKPEFESEYLYYIISFNKHYFVRNACGSTFLEISKKDFSRLKFQMPANIEEQQKISAVLNAADREIEILSKKNDRLKSQKKGLMQQLLTGKVRATTII